MFSLKNLARKGLNKEIISPRFISADGSQEAGRAYLRLWAGPVGAQPGPCWSRRQEGPPTVRPAPRPNQRAWSHPPPTTAHTAGNYYDICHMSAILFWAPIQYKDDILPV